MTIQSGCGVMPSWEAMSMLSILSGFQVPHPSK
jgi:hypothetical protein